MAAPKEMDEPIFEIINGDKHRKIWEDGKIEGFSDSAEVINRIPTMIAWYVNRAIECQCLDNPYISQEYKEEIERRVSKNTALVLFKVCNRNGTAR